MTGTGPMRTDLPVRRVDYDRATPGDTVVARIVTGILGMDWVDEDMVVLRTR